MPAGHGDPAGMDRMSRGLGSRAAGLHSQSTAYAGALSAMPAASFAGGRADRSRAFADQMQLASATGSKAYDVVASFLPRAAQASDEASQADTAAQRARKALAAATKAHAKAEADLAAATAALKSTALLAGAAGPSALWTQARDAAQAAVERTRRELDAARKISDAAERRRVEAERARQTAMRALTGLCQASAVALYRALPEPPAAMPLLGPTLGLQIVSPRLYVLQHEAATLLKVPSLALGAGGHDNRFRLRTIKSLLRHQNWATLDSLAPGPVGPPDVLRQLPAKSGFDKFLDLPGVKGVADGIKSTYAAARNTLRFVDKATDFTHPGEMAKTWAKLGSDVATLASNPGETLKAVIGLDQLEHDPANWLTGTAFSVLLGGGTSRLTKLTGGASKEAKKVHLAAKADYAKTQALVDAMDSPSPIDRLAVFSKKAVMQKTNREYQQADLYDRMARGTVKGTSITGWTDFFAQQAQAEQQQKDGVTSPQVGSEASRLAEHLADKPKGHVSIHGAVHR